MPDDGVRISGELQRLSAAAALITRGQATQTPPATGSAAALATLKPEEYWRLVFDDAIREVARKNAQLAELGVAAGELSVFRRRINGSRAIGVFAIVFIDGIVVRRPELLISAFKDKTVRYEWAGGNEPAGYLNQTQDVRGQFSALVLRLCELVALGFR